MRLRNSAGYQKSWKDLTQVLTKEYRKIPIITPTCLPQSLKTSPPKNNERRAARIDNTQLPVSQHRWPTVRLNDRQWGPKESPKRN